MALGFSCDIDGAFPASRETITLAELGTREIDICQQCKKETGLGEFIELHEEYGVPLTGDNVTPPTRTLRVAVDYPKRPTEEGWPCPVPDCNRPWWPQRASGIRHMMTQHGMSRADASRAMPPHGPSETCPEPLCGFLGSPGQGMAKHLQMDHGQEVYERWKAAAAAS